MRDGTEKIYNFQRVKILDKLARSKNGPTTFALGAMALEFGAGVAMANGELVASFALACAGVIPISLTVASTEILVNSSEEEVSGQQG